MQLSEMCSLIRSKNAGPFTLTFDIMFKDKTLYETALRSGALTKSAVARLYQCPEDAVQWFECGPIHTVKFSIPRPVFQGDVGDTDMHGGQQYAPLLSLDCG